MMQVLDIHPRDLSALLSGLVDKQLLYQEGAGRGMVYFLVDAMLDDAIEELGATNNTQEISSGGLEQLLAIAEPVASKKKYPKRW